MNKSSDDFTIDGVPYAVLDGCETFAIVKNLQTNEIRCEPVGLANEARQKAIYGTRDKRTKRSKNNKIAKFHQSENSIENRDREEMCGRILRAQALASIYKAYHSVKVLKKPLSLHEANDLMTQIIISFGPALYNGFIQKDDETVVNCIRDVFGNAARAVLHEQALDRSTSSVHVRRIQAVMEIGCGFFQEHRTPPTKQYLKDELVRQNLDFGGSTLSKTNEQWKLFFRECGLDDLEDE